jgi:hypothetical protein
MTVRYLLVAIDDEQPLGPQMRAALGVLSWKTVRALVGNRFSLRHLKRLLDMSEISDRQTVEIVRMVRGRSHVPSQEGDAMAGILGGGGGSGGGYIPIPSPTQQQPTVPVPNTGASDAAAAAERLANARMVGRSATILEDYGMATQPAPARQATLGAA